MGLHGGQVGEDLVELAGGFDQAGDRRASEIGEGGRVAVAVGHVPDQAAPAGCRLAEATDRELRLAAPGGDQALQPGQPGHERVRHVARPDRFEGD